MSKTIKFLTNKKAASQAVRAQLKVKAAEAYLSEKLLANPVEGMNGTYAVQIAVDELTGVPIYATATIGITTVYPHKPVAKPKEAKSEKVVEEIEIDF